MPDKKLHDVEPAYAQVRTAQADERIRAAKETIKQAEAQKKLYAPFLPKRG